MADEIVPVKIQITDEGSKKLDDIIARLEKLELTVEKGDKAFKKIGETAIGVFGGNLLTGAFNKITQAASALFNTLIVDGVSAAAESEENFNQLAVALGNAGNFSTETFKRFKALGEEIQNTTKFSDDAVISSVALLESMTNLSADGLEQATKAAVDLAATYKLSLEDATTRVAKAANGQTQSLEKLGIQIIEGNTNAQTFANTMAALASKSGNAEAQLNTFSGVTDRLKNLFNQLQEATGGIITQNPVLIAALKVVGDLFVRLADYIDQNSKALGQDFGKAIIAAIDILKAFTVVAEVVLTVLNFLKNSIETTFTGLFGVLQAQQQFLSGDFQFAWETLKTTVSDYGDGVKKTFTDSKVSLTAVKDGLTEVGNAASAELGKVGSTAEGNIPKVDNNTAAIKRLSDAQKKLGDEGLALKEKLLGQDDDKQFEQLNEKLKAALAQRKITQDEFDLAQAQAKENAALKEVADLQARNEAIKTLNDANAQAEIEGNNAKVNAILAQENQLATKVIEAKAKQSKSQREFQRADEQAFADGLGNLASLQKTGSKELFEIGKAAAIASAIVNTHLAITKALAEGGPFLGPFLAITLGIKGAVEVANIAATHLATGIDSVPGTGSKDNFPALLAPGERVVPTKTNEDLTQFLANQGRTEQLLALIAERSGSGSGSIVVNVGDKEIMNVVNDSLRSGRAFAV